MMAKKAKPRKQKTSGAPGKRGRKPNTWIEGFGPAHLIEYRKKHGLSEAKLGKYLGVTLTTVRNWLGGDNTPSQDKQKVIQDLLSRDYVASPEAEKKARGRGRKPSSNGATSTHENGDAPPVRSSALAEVVAAFVRRLPPEQLLDIDQLEKHIARIKKALAP
jgi:transcriptional regulator with XRE-family HTH domain